MILATRRSAKTFSFVGKQAGASIPTCSTENGGAKFRKKEWQRIGDEIDTAMIFAGASFKRASGADTIKVSRTSPAEFRMKFLNERFVPARGSTTWQQ
jgi:hypothetical protein